MKEDKYENYISDFKNMSIFEKREFIIDNLNELIQLFTKINIDFGEKIEYFNIEEKYETENEFLDKIFSLIISLKELSGMTTNIIIDNLYQGDFHE